MDLLVSTISMEKLKVDKAQMTPQETNMMVPAFLIKDHPLSQVWDRTVLAPGRWY